MLHFLPVLCITSVEVRRDEILCVNQRSTQADGHRPANVEFHPTCVIIAGQTGIDKITEYFELTLNFILTVFRNDIYNS